MEDCKSIHMLLYLVISSPTIPYRYRDNGPSSSSVHSFKHSVLPFLGARWEAMLSTAALRLRVRDNPFEEMEVRNTGKPRSLSPSDMNTNLNALATDASPAKRTILDAMRDQERPTSSALFYGGAFNVERRLLVLVGVDKAKAIDVAFTSGVYRRVAADASSGGKASYEGSRAANAIRSIVERYGAVEWIRNSKNGYGKVRMCVRVRACDHVTLFSVSLDSLSLSACSSNNNSKLATSTS